MAAAHAEKGGGKHGHVCSPVEGKADLFGSRFYLTYFEVPDSECFLQIIEVFPLVEQGNCGSNAHGDEVIESTRLVYPM